MLSLIWIHHWLKVAVKYELNFDSSPLPTKSGNFSSMLSENGKIGYPVVCGFYRWLTTYSKIWAFFWILRLEICLNWTKHGSDKLKNFLKRCVSWVKSRHTPLVEVNQAKCLVLLDKFQVSKSRKSLYFGVSNQSSIKSTNNRIANFSIFWRHTAEMTRLGR